jgi:hypothetical protein
VVAGPRVPDPGSTAALLALPALADADAVFTVIFHGWQDSYGDGRRRLLRRVRRLRDERRPAATGEVADTLHRTLRAYGESVGDMRFVHLAIECRDMLLLALDPLDLDLPPLSRRRSESFDVTPY